VELLSEVKQLREVNRQVVGKSEGIGATGTVIAVAISLMIAFGSFMFAVFGHTPQQVTYSGAAQQPQISVVPVPMPLK
jgi:hypothetical protein